MTPTPEKESNNKTPTPQTQDGEVQNPGTDGQPANEEPQVKEDQAASQKGDGDASSVKKPKAEKGKDSVENDEEKSKTDDISAESISSALASASSVPKKSTAEEMEDLKSVTVDTAFANSAFTALAGISFDSLIGNPLRAAVKAQRDMAKEALNYIRNEAIKVDKDGNGQLTYITLNFVKNGKQAKMRIPLLSLVPYPSLNISQMTYKFTAKIEASSNAAVAVGCDLPSNTGKASGAKAAGGAAGGASGAKGAGGAAGGAAGAGGGAGAPAGGASAGKSDASSKASNSMTPSLKTAVTGSDASEGSSGKSGEASTAAKAAAADALAKMPKSSDNNSIQASYSSKRDSCATRDSRYSVETTMDVTITATNQAPPAGITKIMKMLDESTEVFNADGELTVSSDQLTLSNGHAVLTASYRDGKGEYKREEVKCASLEKKGTAPTPLPNGDEVVFLFKDKGTYVVKAGIFQRLVFVS